jgi:Fe-S cluster biogenesis protein NfuA
MSAENASPKGASERPGMIPPPPPKDLVEDEAAAAHRKVISDALDSIRPNLKRDGGDCELIAVQGDRVWVKMVGACSGCQLSAMTLNGVQAKLVEATGRMIRLFPVTTPQAPVPLRL